MLTRHRKIIYMAIGATLALSVGGGLAGCEGSSPPPAIRNAELPPRTKTRSERTIAVPCPLGVKDASILAEDSTNGIDITLTSFEQPNELRTRATIAAQLEGPFGRKGLGHDSKHGRHGQGHRHGLRLFELPAMTVNVEEIPLGVRLHLVPKHDLELDPLRRQAHERVLQVASFPCED